MRNLVAALLLALLTGCVVRVHERPGHPPPPPPSTQVTVTYGWSHVRYTVWREYYYCDDEEVYYLENCGYDDDDALAIVFIARRARVPIRYVAYEYNRCGRSLYTCAIAFRLDPFVFYYNVPSGYACPGPYARVYGYYWRREPHYLSNAECHALLHLQIGVRYYGYNHVTYFQDYDRCHQRAEPHPFRTIVVRDYHKAGGGNRNCDDAVVVKKDRPWETHRSPHDWDKHRQVEREKVKVVVVAKERDEDEKAKRAAEAEDRRQAFDQARRNAEEAKKKRDDDDRRHAIEEKNKPPGSGRPPVPPQTGKPTVGDRPPEKRPENPPKTEDRTPPGKNPPPPPKTEERKPPERRPEPPPRTEDRKPPEKKPDPPPPPPKTDDRKPPERKPEKKEEPKKSDNRENEGGKKK